MRNPNGWPEQRLTGPGVRGLAVLLLFLLICVPCLNTHAKTLQQKLDAHHFPKLWNDLEIGDLEWLSWTYNDQCSPPQPGADLEMIPLWDIISLTVEIAENCLVLATQLRTENPDLVTLAYWNAVALPASALSCTGWNAVMCDFATRAEDDWHIYDIHGDRVYAWSSYLSSAYLMDIRSDWRTEVPAFLHDEVLSTGLWDGVFFDWAEDAVCWANEEIDLDQNGIADDCGTVDDIFLTGRQAMFDSTRALEGSEKLLIGNGGWFGLSTPYSSAFNGMMIEDFAYAANWSVPMERVNQMLNDAVSPQVCALQSTGRHDNYQEVRFGLCSALMLGSYFAYDGHQNCEDGGSPAPCGHHATWWYDEYSVNQYGWPTGDATGKGYLGDPLGPAYAAGNPNVLLSDALETGTPDPETVAWRRDFQHGIALVNPSDTPQLAALGGIYAKFHGLQDPSANDGTQVAQVTIPSSDGLILLSDIVPPPNLPPIAHAGEDVYIGADNVLFEDDFEDGNCDGWIAEPAGAWNVVDDGGNWVLEGTAPPAAEIALDVDWDDFLLHTRANIGDEGTLIIHFRLRETDRECYRVHLMHNSVLLDEFAWSPTSVRQLGYAVIDSAEWHDVDVLAEAGWLRVFVDGKLEIKTEEQNPIPSGALAYYTGQATIYIDDVQVGLPATVDGTGSMDPNVDDVLTYEWEVTSQPAGSTATLSSTGAPEVAFIPDVAGIYNLGLTVTDAAGESDTDEVRVYAGVDSPAVYKVTPSGDVRADGDFRAASFASGGADVAEWVTVTGSVKTGDVVELDEAVPGTYRLSMGPCSSRVAGVISTRPGVILGSAASFRNRALLALTGIVPVRVTDEGGAIRPGDLLVTSSTPGCAMRWAGSGPCSCALVGKALEPMDGEQGIILVLLTAH